MSRKVVARMIAGSITVVLALPALASAPPDQYDTFNRFDLTIADNFTHLHWQRDLTGVNAMPWGMAFSYCDGLTLAGHTDWRLPSVKELMTLVDETTEQEYVGNSLQTYAIDRNAFPSTPNSAFWAWPQTSGGQAWKVDFSSGESALQGANNSAYVRCVY